MMSYAMQCPDYPNANSPMRSIAFALNQKSYVSHSTSDGNNIVSPVSRPCCQFNHISEALPDLCDEFFKLSGRQLEQTCFFEGNLIDQALEVQSNVDNL